MDFFIRQRATLPLLLMQLSDDTRVDFRRFHRLLENSSITFSMMDERGVLKVASRPGGLLVKPPSHAKLGVDDEYYVFYRFTERDTDTPGTYTGQFEIDFHGEDEDEPLLGRLIVPVKNELWIHVKESFVRSEARTVTCA